MPTTRGSINCSGNLPRAVPSFCAATVHVSVRVSSAVLLMATTEDLPIAPVSLAPSSTTAGTESAPSALATLQAMLVQMVNVAIFR